MPMIIKVKAYPESSRERVEVTDENNFTIRVKEPPTKGLANRRILLLLSSHLNIPIEKIRMISGAKTHRKTFQIDGL